MKILEIIDYLSPGGAQRFVVDLSNELVEYNEVSLLTFRKSDNSDFYRNLLKPQIKQYIYNGTWSILSKIWQIVVVFYYIYKIRPEVVHCHTLAFPYTILPAYVFKKKMKFYYTVHNIAEKETAKGLSTILRKIFLKNCIRPVTISKICDESFREFYGYNSFSSINNGCREIRITDNFLKTKEEIASYKKTKNSKVFLNVARIMEQKNHVLLLDSFELLLKDYDDAILIVIGDDSGCEDSTLIERLHHSPHVYYLGPRSNVSDYMFLSDFFCLSSLWEGLPISLLEAGLSGLYPICTPAGGIKDVIIDQSWGILSSGFTKEDFSLAMLKSIEKSVNREEIKQLYSQKYLMSNCAYQYYFTFNK